MPEPFTILYSPLTKSHLRGIDKKFHAQIRDAIETLLEFEPEIENRNRKPLRKDVNIEATWEIRFGANNRFRVFYDVDIEERVVSILAIGVKEGNRLTIGDEEVEL